MPSLGTLKATLEEINSFLVLLSENTVCLTMKRDGVGCLYMSERKDICLNCLAKDALELNDLGKINFSVKILERIQAGDECLYEEKEYL